VKRTGVGVTGKRSGLQRTSGLGRPIGQTTAVDHLNAGMWRTSPLRQ
jgi:hypothetical protein